MDATSPSDSGLRVGDLEPDSVEARVLLGEIRTEMFRRGEPITVGRFELRSLLGRGAHGSVYLANDTELQRLVAVKLLSATASESTARARLLREAQSLARLKHPNVLTIHDVGVEGERIFIAMEYVEEGTLARWCAEHPPSTRARFFDVLAIACSTGRGLAAAHEAGIVHRDVKPANILVGADGRPRIADFGLARAASAPSDHALRNTDNSGHPSPEITLTRTGDVVGTPAYMAPEQLSGAGDAASDQWSLCVAFWEAAYGERPFDGNDLGTLMDAVRGRPRPPPPERSEVPGWWRAILTRGLSHDPQARWPSVAALVSELDHAATRRRRRVAAVGGGAVVLTGVGAVAGWHLDQERRRTECQRNAEAITEVWNPGVRDALREALVATGVSYAETSFTHAVPYLDAYAADWQSRYAELCVATEVDSARTPQLWAASRQCLVEGRGEVSSLLDLLTHEPDETAVAETVNAVSRLGRLERCSDSAWLGRHAVGEDDPWTADLRRQLRRAHALDAAGAYAQGHALTKQLYQDTAEHPSARFQAQVRLLAGQLADAAGAYEESRDLLTEAFDLALGAGEDSIALGAATKLVHVAGDQLAQHEQGLLWGRVAEGLKTRLGDHNDLSAATLHEGMAHLYDAQGRYEDAERAHKQALAIREEVLGAGHVDVAAARTNLGIAYSQQGRYDEAEREQLQALAIWEKALGGDHPHVATPYNNLGVVYRSLGRFAEAERAYEKALAIREAALEPDHPFIAGLRSSLGIVYRKQGRYAEAERAHTEALAIFQTKFGPHHPEVGGAYGHLANLYQSQGRHAESERAFAKALAIFEEALGADHPHVARARVSLGTAYYYQERYEEAEDAFTRALPLVEKLLGPEHPHVAGVLNNLGGAFQALGRYAEAEGAFARAIAIREKTLGPTNPEVADALVGLVEARLALDQPAKAVADGERALEIATAAGMTGADLAYVQFALAQALWASKGDRTRARNLAERARDGYRSAEAGQVDDVERTQRWLARHRSPR